MSFVAKILELAAQQFCFVNVFGLPGTGKHALVKAVAEGQRDRCFYMNSQKSFKEQAAAIKEAYPNEKVVIIWDDWEYVQNMEPADLEKRLKRELVTFQKNLSLIIISRKNVLSKLVNNKTIFAF